MTDPTQLPIGVLFVCLGNICRSPLAKVIFLHQAAARGVGNLLDVDSCGTGAWHAGRPADGRSVEVAQRHGLALPHTARQLDPGEDFERFEWLIAMDCDNRDEMLHAGARPERVHLIRTFDPALKGEAEHRLEVPDPYHGQGDGFQRVYDMLWVSSQGLLDAIFKSQPLRG